jgi:hypothetical protein
VAGHEDEPRVPAELVMRMRACTGAQVLYCRDQLQAVAPEERISYIERLEREAAERAASEDGLLHDPQEADPEFRLLLRRVSTEAESRVEVLRQQELAKLAVSSPAVANVVGRRGLCHRQWALMKRILREEHGVEWRSPSDMNPDTVFD